MSDEYGSLIADTFRPTVQVPYTPGSLTAFTHLTCEMTEAVHALIVEEYEDHPDLHEWLGSSADSGLPFFFEVERWHRSVGKVSWRLTVFENPDGVHVCTSLDPADPLFAEKAIAWLQRGRSPLVTFRDGSECPPEWVVEAAGLGCANGLPALAKLGHDAR